jgi:hypothetical protein
MLTEITLKSVEDFFHGDNDMVDELGKLDKKIKELETQARSLKAQLIAKGVGKYAGLDYVAEVQHYSRATINAKLVRDMLEEDVVKSVTDIKYVDAVIVKPLEVNHV